LQLDQNDKPVLPGWYELVAVQETKADPTTLALAFTKGVMPAYPDNTFRPKQPVTRAELAAVIVEALGLAGSGTTPQPLDTSDIPPVLRGAVATVIERRIMPTNADGTFRPAQPATRAEAAVAFDAVMNTLQRYHFAKGRMKDPLTGDPPRIAIEDEKGAFRIYRVAPNNAVYRNDRPAELSDLRPGDTLLFLNVGDVGDIVYIEATGP
jgi:S-layer family protein